MRGRAVGRGSTEGPLIRLGLRPIHLLPQGEKGRAYFRTFTGNVPTIFSGFTSASNSLPVSSPSSIADSLQRRALLVRVLGDLGRVVVADLAVERGHQHQRLVDQLLDPRPVGLDAHRAVVVEAQRGIGEQPDRLQEVVGDHRLEDVELEIALARGDPDRGVVAHHLHGDHRHRLGLGRVDLAGHDRGPGLVLGDHQLAEARARPGGQPAHVVGDLHERHRKLLQRA